MNKPLITGIPDGGHSVIFKSAKKGQTSFRITKRLLQSLWNKSKNIHNKGIIILIIPANERENYILKCYLTKGKNR